MSDPSEDPRESSSSADRQENQPDLDDPWVPEVASEPNDKPVDWQPLRRHVDPDSPIVMVETAFLASAASLIWLINFYFPLGPLLQIFFPVPIALVYLRWGHRAAWMAAIVSGLLLSVLMGPVRSLQFIMPYGLLGILLGALWYRRVRWGVAVPIGMLLCVLGAFFRIALVSALLGDDLWLYGTTQVANLLDWVMTRFGLLIQPSLTWIQAIFLGLMVLHSLIYLFVVHLVAWFLFDRLNTPIPRPPHWLQVLLDRD